MTLKPRRVLTLVASFAITAILLVLALYPLDFTKLAQAFVSADYRLVVTAALSMILGYVMRTIRWKRFLITSKRIAIARLFPILIAGFAFNNLLPGRPGEFARAYGVGKHENLSKTLVFATVVVERVVDGIALIAFLMLALAAFSPSRLDPQPVVKTIAVVAPLLFGFALACLIFLIMRKQLALTLFQKITRFLPHVLAARIERMLGSFITGLQSLRSAGDVATIAFLSLAIWGLEASTYFFMLTSFGAIPNLPQRAIAAAMTMVMINFGIMIPAAPGGLGPYEVAGIFALGLFGLEETVAASIALSTHAIQYLIITGLGLVFIWREGISLAQVRAEGNE